jgi:hypothetical protein
MAYPPPVPVLRWIRVNEAPVGFWCVVFHHHSSTYTFQFCHHPLARCIYSSFPLTSPRARNGQSRPRPPHRLPHEDTARYGPHAALLVRHNIALLRSSRPHRRLRVSPTSPLQTHAIQGARTCGVHTAASTPIIRVPPAALRPPRVSSASSTAPLDVCTQLPAHRLLFSHPPPSTPRRAPTVLYASSSTHCPLRVV